MCVYLEVFCTFKCYIISPKSHIDIYSRRVRKKKCIKSNFLFFKLKNNNNNLYICLYVSINTFLGKSIFFLANDENLHLMKNKFYFFAINHSD